MTSASVADDRRRLTLAEAGVRRFEVVEAGACYRLHCPGVGVVFEVDRLDWYRHELHAELLVRVEFAGSEAGPDGVLSVARFNLSNARARTERAAQFERQSRARDVPWHGLVEQLCQQVLAAERAGEPALVLRDVARPDEAERTVFVGGFALPWKHAAVLYGDGASGKSYLALHLAGLLALEGHTVLVADWELDPDDHRVRLERLFGDDMPATLLYSRCARPLVHDVDRLRRTVREQRVEYVVLDSIGFAAHDAPEKADSALGFFRAVRQLGVGSLSLAHVSKAEGGDGKPFGSVFYFNSARAVWHVKATEDGAGNLTIGVFDKKPNLRARQQPFALDVTFGPERTTIRRSEIADVEAFAPQLTILQRVRAVLRAGAMSREQLADALDVKPETLRRQLNRAIERGQLVRFPGPAGVEQIGLAARAS